MAIGTTKHEAVGKRVQIPAYSDLWMRGARFGTVERVVIRSNRSYLDPKDPRALDVYRVRMDHPQVSKKLYGFFAEDCGSV